MTKKRSKRTLVELPLDKLLPHPQQLFYFDNLSEHDLKALADDISRNGLRHKIHVLAENKAQLPANTILDGHQRARALKLLGETTTRVVVRHDLAEADAATVERLFLECNSNRRQLDSLAKASVALRLFEIERKRPRGGELRPADQQDARDRVGKVIGMSGRHLQRIMNILRTPIEVQAAFRSRSIPLVVAAQVADLAEKTKSTIAERIRGGEPPKTVLSDYLNKPKNGHVKIGDAFAGFVRNLQRGIHELDGQVDKISKTLVEPRMAQLLKAKHLIRDLMDVVNLGKTSS